MPPKRKSASSSTPSKKKKKNEDSSDDEVAESPSTPATTTTSDPKDLGLLDHEYDPSTHYKFISFNVNGINALMKKENTVKLLGDSEKPYCICLQETKVSESNSKKYANILPGYTAHFNICTASVSRAQLTRELLN